MGYYKFYILIIVNVILKPVAIVIVDCIIKPRWIIKFSIVYKMSNCNRIGFVEIFSFAIKRTIIRNDSWGAMMYWQVIVIEPC